MSDGSGGGLPPEAIVGLTVGILFSLVLGVAIVVAVLCLVKRRQARKSYSTGKANKQVYGLGMFFSQLPNKEENQYCIVIHICTIYR